MTPYAPAYDPGYAMPYEYAPPFDAGYNHAYGGAGAENPVPADEINNLKETAAQLKDMLADVEGRLEELEGKS